MPPGLWRQAAGGVDAAAAAAAAWLRHQAEGCVQRQRLCSVRLRNLPVRSRPTARLLDRLLIRHRPSTSLRNHPLDRQRSHAQRQQRRQQAARLLVLLHLMPGAAAATPAAPSSSKQNVGPRAPPRLVQWMWSRAMAACWDLLGGEGRKAVTEDKPWLRSSPSSSIRRSEGVTNQSLPVVIH